DAAPLRVRAVDVRAQLSRAVGQLQVPEGPADVAQGEPELRACRAVDGGDGPVEVQAHHRVRHRVEHQLPYLLASLGTVNRRPHAVPKPDPGQLVRDGATAGAPPEEALAHTGDLEPVAVGEQHLGLTEEQVASLVESEVEPVHDLRLRLHVEVHQRVAAYQQIEPGYRGVPRDVVPAEDHPSAQVGAEQEPVVAGDEVPLAQRG